MRKKHKKIEAKIKQLTELEGVIRELYMEAYSVHRNAEEHLRSVEGRLDAIRIQISHLENIYQMEVISEY